MRSDFTLLLWDMNPKPAKVVLPGQVIEIGGIACQFVGMALNRDAYFWIGPGNIRYMNNDEMARFGLKVRSVMDKGKLNDGQSSQG